MNPSSGEIAHLMLDNADLEQPLTMGNGDNVVCGRMCDPYRQQERERKSIKWIEKGLWKSIILEMRNGKIVLPCLPMANWLYFHPVPSYNLFWRVQVVLKRQKCKYLIFALGNFRIHITMYVVNKISRI
jgi:hypothetical protein